MIHQLKLIAKLVLGALGGSGLKAGLRLVFNMLPDAEICLKKADLDNDGNQDVALVVRSSALKDPFLYVFPL